MNRRMSVPGGSCSRPRRAFSEESPPERPRDEWGSSSASVPAHRVTMVALGRGAQEQVASEVSSAGTDRLRARRQLRARRMPSPSPRDSGATTLPRRCRRDCRIGRHRGAPVVEDRAPLAAGRRASRPSSDALLLRTRSTGSRRPGRSSPRETGVAVSEAARATLFGQDVDPPGTGDPRSRKLSPSSESSTDDRVLVAVRSLQKGARSTISTASPPRPRPRASVADRRPRPGFLRARHGLDDPEGENPAGEIPLRDARARGSS
jgi:hypothetical protein